MLKQEVSATRVYWDRAKRKNKKTRKQTHNSSSVSKLNAITRALNDVFYDHSYAHKAAYLLNLLIAYYFDGFWIVLVLMWIATKFSYFGMMKRGPHTAVIWATQRSWAHCSPTASCLAAYRTVLGTRRNHAFASSLRLNYELTSKKSFWVFFIDKMTLLCDRSRSNDGNSCPDREISLDAQETGNL